MHKHIYTDFMTGYVTIEFIVWDFKQCCMYGFLSLINRPQVINKLLQQRTLWNLKQTQNVLSSFSEYRMSPSLFQSVLTFVTFITAFDWRLSSSPVQLSRHRHIVELRREEFQLSSSSQALKICRDLWSSALRAKDLKWWP